MSLNFDTHRMIRPKPLLHRVQMTINGYLCFLCQKSHRRPSKQFFKHYKANAMRYDWPENP